MKIESEGVAVAERRAVPWYLWRSALAVTSAYVGGHWDISWHRSIGRDSFWSPLHIAIYACGVLAAISSVYLIFTTTLGRMTPTTSAIRCAGSPCRSPSSADS
jgi:hypothetical protein